ncbi:hypothetical protein L198_06702 [Cryptococcus wingfieldii CBS 7118]|uniref:Uncharacterized protein n=1 Tax=Cryptococcus wingfieldii CBS 7118 TaxID=1295528 RepID=A0A1E3IL47_9TREE|nr:hypothetical protein L198_06702 [Cryptococcus wingfieldii CBS 7118]ODN88431.1 hypothetical protein L198_06702 [Cryptococcus wingfieldii CBS 7118]
MDQTMLEAGLLEECEEGGETDFDFSVGSEDLAFDDFKDDAEDVSETAQEDEEAKREADEKRKARGKSEACSQATRESIQRMQKVMDEIDRRTEAGSSTNAGRLRMKDLKHQIQKLDEYDAEMEAQITTSLLSGATISLPGTDATQAEEATSENKSMPSSVTKRLSGDKESRRRKALDLYNAKQRARRAISQHEKDLLMANINERTCGSRKATTHTNIDELNAQLVRLDDRDKKRVESLTARESRSLSTSMDHMSAHDEEEDDSTHQDRE